MSIPTTRISLSADPERDAIIKLAGDLGGHFSAALAPHINYYSGPVFQTNISQYVRHEQLNDGADQRPFAHRLIAFIEALPTCRVSLNMRNWMRGSLTYTVEYGLIQRPYNQSDLAVFASTWSFYFDDERKAERPETWMQANFPLPWGTYATSMVLRNGDTGEAETFTWSEMCDRWNSISS